MSIRLDVVDTNINNIPYHLEFGVLERIDQAPTQELRPAFEDSVGGFKMFRGFYRLNTPILSVIASDDFQINLPPLLDVNNNGINVARAARD